MSLLNVGITKCSYCDEKLMDTSGRTIIVENDMAWHNGCDLVYLARKKAEEEREATKRREISIIVATLEHYDIGVVLDGATAAQILARASQ